MSVNYKILCEVKLLHEYYLTDKDGSNIFDIVSQNDRMSFLGNRQSFNFPSLSNHISVEMLPQFADTFKNYKLRIVPAYSGFKLFIAVKEIPLAGNLIGYKPEMPLSDNLPIVIRLRKKDNFIDAFSNHATGKSFPGRYFFTNHTTIANQSHPVLSTPLPLRDDTFTYDQGDLAFDPADNQSKAFYFDKSGIKRWMPVNSNGFVNGRDRSLVPFAFQYFFSRTDNVTEAAFTLKDANNEVVSVVNRSSDTPFSAVSLDYSSVATEFITRYKTLAPLPYTLEVLSPNGYKKHHSVLFCDRVLLGYDTWALLHLEPLTTNPLFTLLDGSGLLITRKNADGSKAPAPLFEIRIRSQFTFWRYINNNNKKIKDNPSLHPFLSYDVPRGLMETNEMQNASYTPIEFTNLGPPQYLPNPETQSVQSRELNRVYTEIRVPESDLFKAL